MPRGTRTALAIAQLEDALPEQWTWRYTAERGRWRAEAADESGTLQETGSGANAGAALLALAGRLDARYGAIRSADDLLRRLGVLDLDPLAQSDAIARYLSQPHILLRRGVVGDLRRRFIYPNTRIVVRPPDAG